VIGSDAGTAPVKPHDVLPVGVAQMIYAGVQAARVHGVGDQRDGGGSQRCRATLQARSWSSRAPGPGSGRRRHTGSPSSSDSGRRRAYRREAAEDCRGRGGKETNPQVAAAGRNLNLDLTDTRKTLRLSPMWVRCRGDFTPTQYLPRCCGNYCRGRCRAGRVSRACFRGTKSRASHRRGLWRWWQLRYDPDPGLHRTGHGRHHPASVADMSVQYLPGSPSGSSRWQATPLSGSVNPGARLLVAEATGAEARSSCPPPM
jgi:hypothetical protein